MILFGESMKIGKLIILSFILIILSISCANASELENDVQDNGIVDSEISETIGMDSNYLDADLAYDHSIELNENINSLGSESSVDLLENINSLGSESSADLLENKNALSSDSSNVHQVNPTTYSKYFYSNGHVITSVVSPGDTIDLSGRFNKKNFIFTIPCSITSSQKDAYLTNCMVEFENVTSDSSSPSSVSNLNFNTSIEKNPCVYILGSSYVDVFNCNAFSNGANSNPTLLVGSSYCNIHDNVFETNFTGYMNMSWKRAGILLGESHYNNIYSNFVTVKDSNGIYLTTYGFEKSNYNVIFNNTITTSAFSEETGLRNPSAWAYGIHLMGDYNLALNNTIMNTYRGVDSEGSFNQIIGNNIFNLSGSYYEGNDGTDGGEGGIYASYDNLIANNTIHDSKITGTAIYAVVNATVYGNVIDNITGPNGIQFAPSASNCLIYNNAINMNTGNGIYVQGSMSNLTLSNNIISTNEGSGILIIKQTKAKYPIDVTIESNCFSENLIDCINFSDVEGKTKVTLKNNTAVVNNRTFFRFFNSDGSFSSNDLFDNFIFKGEFSDLTDNDGINPKRIACIDLNGKVTIIGDNACIKDISFNVNSGNVKIDNVLVNVSNAKSNAFNFNDVENASLANSMVYFKSTNENLVPIFGDNSRISLENNSIIVCSENSALALSNSNCNLLDNVFNSSALSHATIVNDNDSYILYGENEINSLANPSIISINGAIVKYLNFVIDDYNYHEYFNPDGTLLDDVIFNFGDTIRIGNANNKIFRFDIPLNIVGVKGSALNNSFIILEGESSDSSISNFTFILSNCECSGEFSFITIKDGVGNAIISNNKFNANNLTGDYVCLNAIRLDPSDIEFESILIESNVLDIDSPLSQINGISIRNEGLGQYDAIARKMSIANNSISIINNRTGAESNGINLLSCLDSLILNNSIYIKSYNANGILAEKSNLKISDNTVIVDGLNYEKISDYIGDDSLRDLIENNQIKTDSAVCTDKNTYINSDVLEVNVLIENNAETRIIHLSNSLKDLENIIKNAENGSSVDLGNNVYMVSDTIDIDKALSISNGILISNLKGANAFFNVVNNSNGSIDSFNVSSSMVVLDNSNVFAIVNALNDSNPSFIDVPSVNMKGNEFKAIGDGVVPESITLLKIISYRNVLNTNNNVTIEGNKIDCGMNAFKFDIKAVVNGSDIFIPKNSSFYQRLATEIHCEDMLTVAVDPATDGRIGEYFYFNLTDANGKPLSNIPMEIGFNGKVYNYEKNGICTDENGTAKLQINLGYKGVYTFAICFLGNEKYNASFTVAKITVNTQKPVISCSNRYTFKASAKSKKISVSLKSARKKPLENKNVKLVLNGKTYSAKTDSNGVATINVSLSSRKTYSFTVKYAGDSTFSAVTKTGKLIVS